MLLAISVATGHDRTVLAAPEHSRIVEILVDDPADAARIVTDVRAVGGRELGHAPGVVLVEIPGSATGRILEASRRFDAVTRPPLRVDMRPEQVDVPQRFGPTTGGADEIANALAWHDAGITGAGVRIGVIDYFDVAEYWSESEHGTRPIAGVTARCIDLGHDCTSEFFDGEDLGGEAHGVAVVEIIRDMAPDVEIFIGQATSTTDYRELVDWFVSKGVHIVNRSLGSRFDGPGDGRGPLDQIAADAAARGVLWVNSGGNNGEKRYYREAVRLVGDRVAFGPDGDSTFLRFVGCVKLAGVRWATDWDLPPTARTDYDIYLWDSPTGSPEAGKIIDSGRLKQRLGAPPVEYLSDDHCPDLNRSLYLEVRWLGGDPSNDVLEIADYDAGIANHARADHSAAVSIVDSDDAGVIAVGAVTIGEPVEIEPYSSQGPTNDGRIAPDVAAPARFSSVAYGGIFSGTSAAAAVVAGGAALLLDADLAEPGRSLGDLVRHTVIDRGQLGPDSVFGHGEFRLGDPPPATAATAPSTFVALDAPERVLDTRPNRAVGPPELIGELWHGEILDLPIVDVAGLPGDEATAVAVNVVSVVADRPSHVQVLPANRATLGGFANLTVDTAGQTRANFAIVPIGDDGTISIHSIAEGHIVVDLLGWFRAAPGATSAGRFVELPSAQRVLDSRVIAPVVPLRSGEVRVVPFPTGVDRTDIDALVITVTGTRSTGSGFVQAIPSDRTDVVGRTATLNIAPGETSGNAAIVPVGPDGIALTSFITSGGSVDVIVDVTGYITSDTAPVASSGRFVGIRPDRAFDSRRGTSGPLGDEAVVVVDARRVGVPSSASGIVWNVTAAVASRSGHVVGWATGSPPPETAIMAWIPSPTTRSASAVIAVDGGLTSFSVEDGPADLDAPLTHLITDVFGYFT